MLPPTSSVERAAQALAQLPTGGRTPLAQGLAEAERVIRHEARRDPTRRALALVVTDGRATERGRGRARGGPARARRARRRRVRRRAGTGAPATSPATSPRPRTHNCCHWRRSPHDRHRKCRSQAPQAARPAAADRGHGPWQGEVDVGVRDADALVGARVPLRRLPVREVRQVEGRRGEGRGSSWVASTGRRWATAGRGSRATSRSRPTRRARGGRRSSGGSSPSATSSCCSTSSPTRSSTAGSPRTRSSTRSGTARASSTSSSPGRDASPGLIAAADLVSEVTKVKHPMDAGIRAQQGIEW